MFFIINKSKELFVLNFHNGKSPIIPYRLKTDIFKVDSGQNHSCAIKETLNVSPSTGILGCWGSNYFGESDTPSSFS